MNWNKPVRQGGRFCARVCCHRSAAHLIKHDFMTHFSQLKGAFAARQATANNRDLRVQSGHVTHSLWPTKNHAEKPIAACVKSSTRAFWQMASRRSPISSCAGKYGASGAKLSVRLFALGVAVAAAALADRARADVDEARHAGGQQPPRALDVRLEVVGRRGGRGCARRGAAPRRRPPPPARARPRRRGRPCTCSSARRRPAAGGRARARASRASAAPGSAHGPSPPAAPVTSTVRAISAAARVRAMFPTNSQIADTRTNDARSSLRRKITGISIDAQPLALRLEDDLGVDEPVVRLQLELLVGGAREALRLAVDVPQAARAEEQHEDAG